MALSFQNSFIFLQTKIVIRFYFYKTITPPRHEDPSLDAGQEVCADKQAKEAHDGQHSELELKVWRPCDINEGVHRHGEENHQNDNHKPGNVTQFTSGRVVH